MDELKMTRVIMRYQQNPVLVRPNEHIRPMSIRFLEFMEIPPHERPELFSHGNFVADWRHVLAIADGDLRDER